MAHVLKMFQLADEDGMTQMQIGGSGIEAGLHAHGLAGSARFFQALAQVALANDLRRTFTQVGELFVNLGE